MDCCYAQINVEVFSFIPPIHNNNCDRYYLSNIGFGGISCEIIAALSGKAGPLDLYIWDKLDGCAIPSKNGNHNDIGCLAQLEGVF